MIPYTLDSPPPGLSDAAVRGWTSEPEGVPRAGEIWLLSWENLARGIVLVTKVIDDFILGMPIRFENVAATSLEVVLDDSVLGVPATLFVHAETGLGEFLLHRRVISAFTADQISQLRSGGEGATARYFRQGDDRADAQSASLREEVLGDFQSLCYLEWPALRPGEATLRKQELVNRGLGVSDLAKAGGLNVPDALHVWKGDWTVDGSLIDQLERALSIDTSDLLQRPVDRPTRDLARPDVKGLLLRLAQIRNISEREARNLTRSQFALAARAESVTARAHTLARDTLNRLIEESIDTD